MESISVTYQNPPLVEAIFQLRFSPILQIETELPALFQEKIRYDFPDYVIQNQFHQEISGNVESNQFINETRLTTTKNHTFSNKDKHTTVILTRDFIALSTHSYGGWFNFKEDLLAVLNAFTESYNGSAYTRIGLRYINVIDRVRLDLDLNTPWKTLIKYPYLGLLADDKYGSLVNSYDAKSNLLLSDTVGANIALSTVVNVKSNDPCLSLDIDCFSSSISEDIEIDIELLHNYCEEIFKYGITTELHEAMKPANGK